VVGQSLSVALAGAIFAGLGGSGARRDAGRRRRPWRHRGPAAGLSHWVQGRPDGLRGGSGRRPPGHAVAFTPTVVALLDAKLIGDRIFLFVLLADREGERAIKILLEERRDR
jgi:hypothetical protein